MNLTRCNQGHFYDADKYSSCPHCDKGQSDQSQNDSYQQTVASASVASDFSSDSNAVTQASSMSARQTASQGSAPENKGQTLKSEVDDVQKTVGMFNVKQGAKQPVAGWLVCVEGPHLGEDFRIVMGRNFVGRAQNMDIVLSKDNSVSRDKHAIIIYEPKGNIFLIQAGDSKELFYLNDKVVLSTTELNVYDNIKIGSSVLLFVPFCSDKFNWNDIEEEEK